MPARKYPDVFVCKGCGDVITRKASPARDYRRTFCSSTCKLRDWFRTHEKKWYPPSEARVLRLKIQDAIESALSQALRQPGSCSVCGLSLGDEGRRHAGRKIHIGCKSEYARQYTREYERAKRADPEYQEQQHPPTYQVCACCGEGFTTRYSDRRRLYCSARCNKAMRDYHIGGLSRLELKERNRLAAMIALVKQARRVMNHGSPKHLASLDVDSTRGPKPSDIPNAYTAGGTFDVPGAPRP